MNASSGWVGAMLWFPKSKLVAALATLSIATTVNSGSPLPATDDDADEPPPVMQIAAAGGNVVVHWPLSAAGFALQSSTDLASRVWTNRNDPVAILAGQNYVTNPPLDSARIYRLRFPFP